MEFLTIGVYGYTEEEFFSLIEQNNIDLFLDVRQRRGMRGKKYSFVNSTYLQQKLEFMNISYKHEKLLAPTPEIRNFQKLMDSKNDISKQSRTNLGEEFKNKYIFQIMEKFDFDKWIKELDKSR